MQRADLQPLVFDASTTPTNQGTAVPTDYKRSFLMVNIINTYTTGQVITLFQSVTTANLLKVKLDAGASYKDRTADMQDDTPVFSPVESGTYLASVTQLGSATVSLEYVDEEGL